LCSEIRACLKITLRRKCGKFYPELRYFFRRIARIRLQKMPFSESNLALLHPKAKFKQALTWTLAFLIKVSKPEALENNEFENFPK